jgi:hypothetical protein
MNKTLFQKNMQLGCQNKFFSGIQTLILHCEKHGEESVKMVDMAGAKKWGIDHCLNGIPGKWLIFIAEIVLKPPTQRNIHQLMLPAYLVIHKP